LADLLDRRFAGDVPGREAAAQIQHLEFDAVGPQPLHQLAGRAGRGHTRPIVCPAARIALRHAPVLSHSEPTWKVTPYGRSPSRRASSIRSYASSTSAPTLPSSGNTLVLSSTSRRT